MKTFIIFFLSLSAFAHEDCVNCLPVQPGIQHSLEEFSNRLEHWSASPTQVMSAPCKTQSFDSEEMNQSLASLTGTKDKRIRGVRFKDENPQLLNSFQKLTQKGMNLNWFMRLFMGESNAEINIQADYNVNPECEKVICAVDKIWGRDVGRKLLYLHLNYGYNGSELVGRDAVRFTDPELDNVLISLKDLPRSLMPMGRGRPLVKSSRSHENPNVVADSEVRLYSPWMEGDVPKKQYTLVHEFGHNLHSSMSMEVNRRWSEMSSWRKLGDSWEYDLVGACMVSRYGMTSPNEDFAEVATAYRYNGRALLKHCPEKYQFMKDNVFRGVEYREESQCSGR